MNPATHAPQADNTLPASHWHVAQDEHDIAWLTLDSPGTAVNVLTREVMAELGAVLARFETMPPRALIIRSGKPGNFIVGADINEFGGLDTPEKARELVARGWHLFNTLAAVRYPTLALVRGHCLGGGTELALACRWRIVVDEPATSLGLPEVMLGIFPGWGGMRRLPALIGPPAALDLMLTGKTVDARRALSLGLADLAVPPRVMEATARLVVLQGGPKRRTPLARRMQRLLDLWPVKRLVARRALKTVEARDPRGHYPAPRAIIDIWANHGGNALNAPGQLASVIGSPTARNLLRVFRLREQLKAQGKQTGTPARRVHVIGAGVMGGDIAAWCAYKGLTVSLQDQDGGRLATAIGRAQQLYARKFRRDLRGARAAADRLIPDPQGAGVAHADIVIEAISENLEAKLGLYREIAPRMKADAILATNTSSLRLEDLSQGLPGGRQLVGIHFFNPVASMPLVEVVHTDATPPALRARAAAFVGQLDKLALPVRSAPGFLVNAVLAPYMLEAMRCVDEGLAPSSVDAAMEAFGMPMGPLELADTVGLDIAMAAGKQLSDGEQPPACLVRLVDGGKLGRKSGKGFYIWEDGKPQKDAAPGAPPGLASRLLAPLLARTHKQVDDGVVASAELADAGIIFGTGFAPFTGGPLHWEQHAGQAGAAAPAAAPASSGTTVPATPRNEHTHKPAEPGTMHDPSTKETKT